MQEFVVTISLVACVCAAAGVPAMGSPRANHPGGYGPIRLGMPESEAKAALARLAKDASFLSMAAMEDDDPAAMAKMVVTMPWEDTYVGTVEPTTRLQFGVHAGHVVSVNLRSKFASQGQECRAAFAALLRRDQAEFGPIQAADVPSNPSAITDAKASFAGWTLWLSRLELEPCTCNLTADYVSDEDDAIEKQWRASRR